MINVISLSQAMQAQPLPADTPRPVQAVQPVKPTERTESGPQRDATRKGVADSMEANVVRSQNSSLQFRIDQDYDRLVVSLLDENGEVIRQIPSELVLRLAQRIEQIQNEGKLGLDELV